MSTAGERKVSAVRGFARTVSLALLLAAAAVPGMAQAELIGVCAGGELCVASETGKTTQLTRDGAGTEYSSPSVSSDGGVLGYLRGGEPFLGAGHGEGAKSLFATSTARTIRVSPDGGSFVIRTFDSRVGISGFELQSNLRVGGAIGSRLYSSSSTVFTPGFVAGKLAVTPAPESADRGVACTVALIPSEVLPPCGAVVAAQSGRTLGDFSAAPDGAMLVAESSTCDASFNCSDPSLVLFDAATGAVARELYRGAGSRPEFSPDGKQVAFTAGADTLVVAVAGGPPTLLVKNLTDATWAATTEPRPAGARLKLNGTKLALRARCSTLGGCAKATWVLRQPAKAAVLAKFEIPALVGKTRRRVETTLGSAAAALIKRAGTAGLRLRLSGVEGRKRPANVTAVG
jgi:hypothetical protein